jgi:hypothetical protein
VELVNSVLVPAPVLPTTVLLVPVTTVLPMLPVARAGRPGG